MPQGSGAGANFAMADARVAVERIVGLLRRGEGRGWWGGGGGVEGGEDAVNRGEGRHGTGIEREEMEWEIGWACAGYEAEAWPRAFAFTESGGKGMGMGTGV